MTDIPALKKRLTEANSTIGRLTDNGEINRLVEEIITDITEAEYASVWMYDEALVLRRERREGVKEISMETKEGLLYKCFATKEAGIYNYLTSEKGYVPHIDNPDAIRMKSKIMIPLIFQDEFIGIVTAYASVKKIKNFTNEDLKLFRAITPFVIDAIFAMRANLHRGERRERRGAGSGEDNGLRRRSTDTIENLDHIAAERESVQDTQAILDFTSNIVHDIRTPANGLLGFLEILEEQIEDKRLKEYLSHAKSSASLISDLTTSILDGISEKREPLNDALERVNTVKFFSEIAEIFSANMYKKEIHYNIFIDPTLPKEIELDTMRVKRVLMNLIGNASKFTPEHGAIEFSARYKQKEKKLHLFVKDNGIGIAKEKQEDIFNAFQQAEENTKALFGGTGLGLSICAAYVKEMGGKLLVDSELDKGSVFYFDIPLDIKEEMPMFKPVGVHTVYLTMLLSKKNVFVANHIARYLVKTGMKPEKIKAVTSLGQIPENTTHLVVFENMLEEALFSFVEKQKLKLMVVEEQFLSLKSDRLRGAKLISQYSYFGEALYTFICARKVPRVLIVEDDKISALLLTTMFEEEYCDVATAENGEEGLKILQHALEEKRPYDLVYTDHNMPLLSGSEMLARYRRIEQEASVARPVVTVSISGEPEKDDAGFPFDFFAAKPFRKQEIITIFLNTIKTNKGVTDAKT
jgi:signal transduction histidine kinase